MTDPTHPDAQAIWSAVRDMYDAYLDGDRERSNSHIAPDVTLWDTAHEPLVSTRDGLDALRDTRPEPDPATRVVAIETGDPVIDVWGDIALVRHTFEVVFASEELPRERVRNTGVWHRRDGRWLVVHNHEDVLPS
ncbi:nuclear transport factor 2 family protein [Homoserinibacter sp. GY 40078]|uniref:YybH family protein n=1 Tax=Homoserinibacter sp. GY 40078 TaxID=2603275 RepID=UPI0011CC9D57|nr:nuclear transport factor 2 family protein [Homoserinibacter sp. GY 40078]TXK19839.1 nuclear transport factor 2 family protein [Homoserinibacter sp. GY 40078]